jgi:hypothetical protein
MMLHERELDPDGDRKDPDRRGEARITPRRRVKKVKTINQTATATVNRSNVHTDWDTGTSYSVVAPSGKPRRPSPFATKKSTRHSLASVWQFSDDPPNNVAGGA